ncbi:MAG: AzlC family ABC transporter permease [Lachnospiraceae bacterium]|nr:AzlC family ABC transporter permease [Ruminococcus sp.]MCM1274307.1 AzlC family ABC transporter permease [Lachnospiraceae bacterium]
MNVKLKALKAAFPKTIPIMTGFLFLGAAYGIYARTSGLAAAAPILMAAVVFAGSMEFVAVDMLCGAFDPLNAFLMAVMVNARHLFYGVAMLDKYKSSGKKRWYLIFGLCDESFSINCTADVPEDVDRGWFYFWVTLLNQLYWITGAAVGSLAGSFIHIELPGLDFVMTALLVVIFIDNWLKEKSHLSSLIGVAAALVCLLVFGSESFIIPSMLVMLVALTVFRKPIEKAMEVSGNE